MRDVESIATDWCSRKLSPGWTQTVTEALAHLADGEARGWQKLAMLYGDTRAPELCVVTALHGLAAPSDVEKTLRSHVNLALMDLGLASSAARLVKLSQLDTDVEPSGEVDTWLANFIRPLGDLPRAAAFCARLAAIRGGLHERPDPFSVDAVLATLD